MIRLIMLVPFPLAISRALISCDQGARVIQLGAAAAAGVVYRPVIQYTGLLALPTRLIFHISMFLSVSSLLLPPLSAILASVQGA